MQWEREIEIERESKRENVWGWREHDADAQCVTCSVRLNSVSNLRSVSIRLPDRT